jgi:acyl-CoA synthetase (AMP-forming)/AMP-acid ligase II
LLEIDMPFKSTHPPLNIPECNLLSFLFPSNSAGTEILWTDAEDDSKSLSADTALRLIRRVAKGLDDLNIPSGSSILLITPNHIYVPILYLAAIGSGRIYTATNPTYNVDEIVHGIKTVKPAIILAHPGSMANTLKAVAQVGMSTNQVYSFADTEGFALPKDVRDWRSILASEGDAESWQWPALEGAASRETIAVINFSSGTTVSYM